MTTFTINQSSANDNINANISQLTSTLHQAVHGLQSPPKPTPTMTAGPSGPPTKEWYAVVIGRNPGVYNSTMQLFDQIQRFKDSFYRDFDTESAAEAWLEDERAEYVGKKQSAMLQFTLVALVV
jgi:hypothetical protein